MYLSSDMIGKIEQGQRTPTEQFITACENIPELEANGALRELRDQLKDFLSNAPTRPGSRTGRNRGTRGQLKNYQLPWFPACSRLRTTPALC